MRAALVTGIAGFAGSHLAEYLLSKKIKVFGFFLSGHSNDNIEHLKNRLNSISVDLQNKKAVEREVAKIKPDLVFHLAAYSSPPKSFEEPQATLENNINSQINLLDALVKIKSKAKILIVGSAEEYGDIDPKDLPADEETPLVPLSPYAVSKVAQDLLGYQYCLHHKLQIVRVRPFNHIGPRQSPLFVVSAFASQIADLEKSGGGVIKVGNLNTWRDFTDVRDMVRAYLLALDKGIAGEVYNLGSGKAVKIADILEKLLSQSSAKITVKQDKKRQRAVDIKKVYCDFSKFKRQTGWAPKIALAKTLADTLKYERDKLK